MGRTFKTSVFTKLSDLSKIKTPKLSVEWNATENPTIQLKERSSAESGEAGRGAGEREDPAFSPPPPPLSHAALPGDFAAARLGRRQEEQQLAVGNGGGRRQLQQQHRDASAIRPPQQHQVFQGSGRKGRKEGDAACDKKGLIISAAPSITPYPIDGT